MAEKSYLTINSWALKWWGQMAESMKIDVLKSGLTEVKEDEDH